MVNPIDSQRLESYVPEYDAAPEKWEEARSFFVENMKKLSQAINIREIGWYLDEELLSGKAFIPGINETSAPQNEGTSQQFRTILRKVIVMPTLPNTGTITMAHGIMVDNNFTLIQLYGAATDPTNLVSIPIPYASVTATAVEVLMTSTNIVIFTQSNRSTFTRCFITVEYLQEL